MKSLVRAFVIGSVLAAALPAFAATDTLNWGAQVNPGSCDAKGKLVVNVTQKVVNDADSGVAGNYWALDTFNKHIQVWAQADGSYCAVVRYTGKFDAIAGQTSPGGTGTLTGNEQGTIEGGYSAVINGTLLGDPTWPTRGSVGTTDYQCDVNGNCPGAVDWIAQYFGSSYGFSYNWWGWIYQGGGNGTWVNASTGNSGDIGGGSVVPVVI